MSNIFYRFLSERIIDYFYKNHPTSGEKYHILVEKEDQVKKLYRELKTNTLSHRFSYRDAERDQEYDTYELNFGEIGLLVAASMEGGPHPDFLATLRNMVGVEKEYKNKAILFIHSSSSDSILGGSGSLSKEGMPLNIAEIEKYINQKINTNGYSELDQKILKQYMKNKKRELEGMTASFFEYEDVVECLSNSQIAANQYRKFGLFPDKRLTELTGKKLEESLEENHKNYVKVAGVHSYGDDYSSLETWYGENGEKALSKENWEDISFSEVEKYISSRKNKSSIEYCPMLSTTKIWDKEEGDTKAKGRIRNILVFLDENEEEKEFLLEFSEYTNKKCISVSGDYNRYLTVTTSGKKLKVQLHNVEDSVVFFRFKYTAEGKKFDFKIAVLRCAPEFLENIKSCYSIEMTGKKTEFYAIRIRTDEDKVILNKDYEKQREVVICENRQPVAAEKDEKLIICIGEDYPYSEDSDDIYFSVGVGGTVIPMLKTFVTDAKTSIKGLKLWYLKHSRQCDFEIRGDNSLLLGTKPYYTQDEFRKSLDLEKSYIDTGSPFVIEELENSPELKAKDIILPDSVRKSFDAIISYFRESGKLPSLSYINPQLKVLYENYIQSVIAVIDAVPEGTYLKKDIKGLFYLGMVKREYGDREILLSPLHPVNIAYQLFIQNTDIRGIEEEQYTLLRKYQQTSLLPYINFNPATEEPCIYSPVEQMDSPEWKIYVEESLPRYKTSKDFVSKLVFEKIKEFTTHFSYLFGTKTAAPIRINLINTGDCREIVQGILKYYAHELKDTNGKHLIPVQVTMYYSYKMDTVFELMSRIEDPDELRKMLGFSEKAGNADFNDIIEAYRNNVHFYSRILDGELGYAHITFMEMDDEHQAVNTLMRDIPSGVVMNGISSGVPAERLGDSYRTGFGVKYANTQSQLMNISMKYNALNAAMNGETYRSDSCYALKIGHNRERLLDRIYDSSNWVTFINPKVDLS